MVNVQSMIAKVLQSPPTIQVLKNKLDQIKTEMEGLVRRVLQVLADLNAAHSLSTLIR